MYDDIVRQITLAVMSRLASLKDNKLLVLGEEKSDNWQNTLRINGYSLEYSTDGGAIEVSNYKAVIIENLSVFSLTSLSNMQPTNSFTKFVMNALLLGKRVVVLKEGVEFYSYENTASRFLYQELLRHESRLENFGLMIVSSVDLAKTLAIEKNNSYNRTEIAVAEVVINERKIIDMAKNAKDKTIVVAKNTVITPLAYDYIKENNINVIFE